MKSGVISNFDKIDNDHPKMCYEGDLKIIFFPMEKISKLVGNGI